MANRLLGVTIEVNNDTGDVETVYFKIRKGQVAKTLEVSPGIAFADYDGSGHLLGLELLAPCQISVLNKLAKKEPVSVKNFLRQSIPRQMVA